MIITASPTIKGKPVKTCHDIVVGDTIMGANMLAGVDFDYAVIGSGMLMVSASGTAVTV